jgi:Ca2+-binding EF-hand superfamily protein
MRHTFTLLLLLLLTPVALAADPGRLERGFHQYGPKADAFALGTNPYFRAEIERRTGPFRRDQAAAVADTYEILFLARTRPVRVRVVARVVGQTLNERFDAHLKTLFAAFDRDGDGSLNRYEAELIYSRSEFQQMLRGGFGFRGQTGKLPTLDTLDRDSDRRVSYEEFADYYTPDVSQMTQTRPVIAELRGADQLTTELFARLDTNQDGRLSEAELKAAEKILTPLDADEDETVSTTELLAGSSRTNLLGVQIDGNTVMMAGRANPSNVPPDGLHAHLKELPNGLLLPLVRWYDTDNDEALSAKEIGFPQVVFDRLDANKDGKLTAKELEAWRTGPPDVTVTVTVGSKVTDCKAETTGEVVNVMVPKQTTPDRIVLQVGTQTIDVAAVPLAESARQFQNPYAYLFPPNKQFLEEKELVGPQYQFLRVAFEPADFDGDGKLSRAEFDRYFELQMKTAHLGFTLSHAVRVPNLFQLLDGNADGKLGVKELRTAYARLIPLEPTGDGEVTRAILQPSAMARFGHTFSGASNVAVVQPNPNLFAARSGGPATDGPVWFRKMDRNGDGDVSRTEFLGSKDDFDKLDANTDGLISLDEATAYEKSARPGKK